ncbi:LytTR family DNA-binding domain-containing protein [Hymenobacter sp. H14-R3]|uniref:LytR/AlgR family response regulator transcription factor n=1 Tax=Hymenobacter sp. H14-R3 TaxID=3046308 RepID=UPI0024BB0D62|nr:LytTR family DNA-binding domain-containing protein [Hymenobacter sp. H14-R3]MDJ0364368.1 LytTR family DNA-binding domain-containing protein [Hymenobacter sp. H14-R3]
MKQRKHAGASSTFVAGGAELAGLHVPPPLPLVENSFKHGRHHFSEAASVVATLTAGPGTLHFTIENDMLPVPPPATPPPAAAASASTISAGGCTSTTPAGTRCGSRSTAAATAPSLLCTSCRTSRASAAPRFPLSTPMRGLLKVPHRAISYVEGCKDYVKVVTTAKTYLHHATLKEMAELLGAPFVRVHRSFIVGAAHIKLLQPEQLVLADNTAIPLGLSYKAEVGAYFKKGGPEGRRVISSQPSTYAILCSLSIR